MPDKGALYAGQRCLICRTKVPYMPDKGALYAGQRCLIKIRSTLDLGLNVLLRRFAIGWQEAAEFRHIKFQRLTIN